MTTLKDKTPPNSPESEQGLLGCCLLDPNVAIDAAIELLPAGPEMLYDGRHQFIYESLLAMRSAGIQVDLITVQQHLKDRGHLEAIGGVAYLCSLQDSIPSASNLAYYAPIIRDKYILRQMLSVCSLAITKIQSSEEDATSLIDEIERDILKVRQFTEVKEMPTVKELVGKAIDSIEENFKRQGAISGLSTGLPDLDKLTDGMHPGEMIIIAAFPSGGKTSLAMNIAEHTALQSKCPVGVFSLEMTGDALIKRALGSVARVNLRKIEHGDMTTGDFPKLTTAASKIAASTIYIDDTSDMSIYTLRAKARRMWKKYGIKLFVVDYLQLLNAIGGPRKLDNRQEEVRDISNGLKAMAKELGVTVIVLSQLNDDGKLRDSRVPGQDTDGFWLLSPTDENKASGMSYPVDLWLKKQRNGERNVKVQLQFEAQYTRFESVSPISDSDIPLQHRS